MITPARAHPSLPFPRFFWFGGYPVNSYKVFLCVGIYAGILAAAVVGQQSGLSPLRLGMGLLVFAIAGCLGARLYHLAVNVARYRQIGFAVTARSQVDAGWSVLGGLVVFPLSGLFDSVVGIPLGVFWDHMAIAIAVGGGFIRFGCICNGCCVGRESGRWFARRQHDVRGIYRRRIPVQWLEIGWWGLACAGLLWLWPARLPTGAYAACVIGWYGLGRVWLEPLREQSTWVSGFRVDQVVAALAAAVAAGYLWVTL